MCLFVLFYYKLNMLLDSIGSNNDIFLFSFYDWSEDLSELRIIFKN